MQGDERTQSVNEAGPEANNRSARAHGWRRNKRWLVLVAVVVAAVAVSLWLSRGSSTQEGRPVPAPAGQAVPSPSTGSGGTQPREGEITITISPDKLESAQIKTETVPTSSTTSGPAAGYRTTGTVQSNSYKDVPVLPVTGGIVREVNAQLGDRVKRGQPLAVIFSSELANAEGEYLKMLAELDEHHKHHLRALELLEIGAISREDLEQAVSKYTSAQANVVAARQRLVSLGMTVREVEALKSPEQVRSLISITAPSSGTVVSRTVNSGEVIAGGKELFRIADLGSLWVIGQVYESGLANIRVGTASSITTVAYPDRTFEGRVSYIDPRLDPQTRTVQVRVELKNPGELLKIGMSVDVSFGKAGMAGSAIMIPKSALQMIGDKQVVFVATDRAGVFVQREVRAGAETNGFVPVYSGISGGERVVTDGSFLLRAESLRIK